MRRLLFRKNTGTRSSVGYLHGHGGLRCTDTNRQMNARFRARRPVHVTVGHTERHEVCGVGLGQLFGV